MNPHEIKQASPNHSILPSIVNRWSPYRFLPKTVEEDKLKCCFEAARWAASSYNDQPWGFILASRDDSEAFNKMLGCLLEANQGWAKNAGALIITVTRKIFQANGKPNRVALHDLGQAAAHFALQATELGLQVHQMAGINLTSARLGYKIPDDHEPQTAIAVGYPDLSDPDGTELAKRDAAPRSRKTLSAIVFQESYGISAFGNEE